MARIIDREKAMRLRLKGASYSEIKKKLGISKSTLSYWLHDYPLSPERIRELRDKNPRRIEKFRNTMRKKKEATLFNAYQHVKKDISKLTKRELFIAGFILYWAEGTKASRYTTALANTDPTMLRFFITWLELLGVKREKLRVRLHIYSDMDIKKETKYWSKELGISSRNFRSPYIKKTEIGRLTYKGGFGHGTCNILVHNRDINDYVVMGIQYIREQYL